MPSPRRPLLAAALLAAVAPALAAQQPAPQPAAPVVERPVAFDSAGRVLVLTPALVARLGLAAPAFPVRGPFTEARLFAAPEAAAAGAAVLSVTRAGGAVERYALAPADRAALAAAITQGLASAGGGLRGDSAVAVSAPAGRAFVRNQTGLGLFLYGPAAALLTGASETGALLAYTGAAGASFVTSLAIARQQPVTRAQATLSGSMALGVAAAGAGAVAIAGSEEPRAYGAALLAGGLAGSVLGFRRGAGLTDAEASASATAAFLAVGTAAGLTGATDAYTGERYRGAIGAGIAALAAGYAAGPRYARTRAYAVTAGDVESVTPVALAGAALGAAAGWAGSDRGGRGAWLGATAGFVAGAVTADRALVRRRDHTPSEGDLVGLGAAVGAGLGAALASAADTRTAGGLAFTGAGALAGIGLAEALLAPAPDGGRRLRTTLAPAAGDSAGRRLRLSPSGLLLARAAAARGGRGTFPLGSLTF